jgi:hypothetical protein
MSPSCRFVAACIWAYSTMAAQQGEIAGTVIDSETGKPIPHARVTAMIWTDRREGYGDVLVAFTSDDGRFRFAGLPKGEGEVRAERAGYGTEVRADHGRSRSDDLSVPLTFRLTPKGVLTVRAIDDSGLPVDGAQVAIVRRGEENLPYAINLSVASVDRDGTRRVLLARGSYRIVVVSPGTGNLLRARDQTFLPTYYPGTTIVGQSDWIDVVPGKEVEAVVPITPIPARQIRGRLGFAGTLIQASILPAGNEDYYVTWGLPQVSKGSGEFRVSGLTPGVYVLDVNACLALPCIAATGFRKIVQITDSDIDNLVISEADRLSGN